MRKNVPDKAIEYHNSVPAYIISYIEFKRQLLTTSLLYIERVLDGVEISCSSHLGCEIARRPAVPTIHSKNHKHLSKEFERHVLWPLYFNRFDQVLIRPARIILYSEGSRKGVVFIHQAARCVKCHECRSLSETLVGTELCFERELFQVPLTRGEAYFFDICQTTFFFG